MKSYNKLHLALSIFMLTSSTLANAGGPEEEALKDEVRKFRKIVIDEKIKGEPKKTHKIDNEGEPVKASESMIVAYLVSPENPNGSIRIGNAVLAIIGGTEQDPTFWASEFVGSYNNPQEVMLNILAATRGHVNTIDCTSSEVVCTYAEGLSRFRGLAAWKYDAWSISLQESVKLKRIVSDDQASPPNYSFSGANFNLAHKDVRTCNNQMWAQETLLNIGKLVDHLKIVRGYEAPFTDLDVWIAGTRNKTVSSMGGFITQNIMDKLSSISIALFKGSPLEAMACLGNEMGWLVGQAQKVPELIFSLWDNIKGRKRAYN